METGNSITGKKRFTVGADLWDLLNRLADNAKMHWFYAENYNRKTIPSNDVECLTSAFIRENFWNFQDCELFTVYNFFVKASIPDPVIENMATELLRHLSMQKLSHSPKS